ncbi:SRPBCC family protein [Streptosporangium sp. NPDC048047]|uniref:SRPBCC family protein n=1 Tax=Streptosporangium sp. NPDC048047 TaxID=3155748 RepID=UPI003425EB3B
MAMRFEHEFTVPVPVEQAWSVLLDVERIAPCLPGAALEKAEGDSFTGRMKVKVGPITVIYRGEAAFENMDEDARTLTLRASGRETRGSGTANATVTARLRSDDAGGPAGPADSATRVVVETSFNVTGRPAQFGRGVMGEVGAKLIDRFAANLAALLEAGEAGPATADTVPLTPVPAPESAVPEEAGEAGEAGEAPPGRVTGAPESAVQGTTGAPRTDGRGTAGAPQANGQGTTGAPGTGGQDTDGTSEADGRGTPGRDTPGRAADSRGADGRKETARHLTAVPSPTETPEGTEATEATEAKEPERPDTPETAEAPVTLAPVTELPPAGAERAAGRDSHPAGTSRTSLTPDEEALDLMEIAGIPLLKRAAPLLAAVAGLAVAAWLTRRALRRR